MVDKYQEPVIVAYGRSAIAKANKGSLQNMHPVDVAGQVLDGVLKRIPQLDRSEIDDVIIGCARQLGVQNSNIARIISLRAGLPVTVPAQTITRLCGSGLQAIASAANAIATGQYDVAIAGGVECMTKVPMGTPEEDRCKWITDNEPAIYMAMGLTAENVAEKYGISRIDMDRFALQSHRKAKYAQDNHRFDGQIIPVVVDDSEKGTFIFDKDECIRPETTLEALAALKPRFKDDGLVTAGTSSPLNDGASMVVLMSKDKAKELGIKPIAEMISYSVAGVDPALMGIGPVVAVPKALKKAGLTIGDMDVIELNEAFASQAIACISLLGMDQSRVNPNGGAIALGHPLGATGVILTCKALSELALIGGTYALVTMCIGGGMGTAGIFRMC